jgi:hypothetical protein
MDLSIILTIIGLLATFVFGFLSIDLFKRKRYPGKITFVKQSSIGLFDSFVKNFNEIAILFEDKPIKDNLIYIKGCFINDGDIDIEGEKIEKPICIELPEKYSWVNCKITDTTKNLLSDYNIANDKNVELKFGLFRKGEFIQIEALIQASHDINNDDNIFDLTKFTHRISQTQKITLTNLLSENQIKKKKGKIIQRIWSTAIQMILPFIFSIVLFVFLKSAEINYRSIENGKTIEYKATPKRDGIVELKDLQTDEEKSISIIDFQDKSKYLPFIPEKTLWQKLKESWFIIPAWLALIVIFGLLDYWEVRKSNKIYRILSNKE